MDAERFAGFSCSAEDEFFHFCLRRVELWASFGAVAAGFAFVDECGRFFDVF